MQTLDLEPLYARIEAADGAAGRPGSGDPDGLVAVGDHRWAASVLERKLVTLSVVSQASLYASGGRDVIFALSIAMEYSGAICLANLDGIHEFD